MREREGKPEANPEVSEGENATMMDENKMFFVPRETERAPRSITAVSSSSSSSSVSSNKHVVDSSLARVSVLSVVVIYSVTFRIHCKVAVIVHDAERQAAAADGGAQ